MYTCEVVEKVSKAGNPYTALKITFPNGYVKIVFLDQAEKYMVENLE